MIKNLFTGFCAAWIILFSLYSRAQIIRTIAGTGAFGTSAHTGDGTPAATSALGGLWGIAVDTAGNIYFADQYHFVVKKISRNGILSTYAGTGTTGYSGDGGPATNARLSSPSPLILDPAGNLYIGDASNKVVRKVTPAGIITTIAGKQSVLTYGTGDGGPATNAGLGSVSGLARDAAGNLYIADGNTRVRKVNTAGIITTVVGGAIGYAGNGGQATAANFNGITDVAVDAAGNLYVSDANNYVIRKINTAGIVTVYGGTNTNGVLGDGGIATSARISLTTCLRLDAAGNLYFADQGNNRVRVITTGGIMRTLAGSAGGFSGDGGPATASRLHTPTSLAFDTRGNMFIVDRGIMPPTTSTFGRRIREILAKVDTFHLSVLPGNVLCGNSSASFVAHPTHAYYTYAYRWKINGAPVGTNSPNFASTTLHNNDTVTCTIVDTAANTLLAVSDTIIMTILPPILPVLHVSSTGDTVCAGLPITFTATATNGGLSPVFKWYVFGVLRGTGPTFNYIPVTGDIVTCVLTSNDPCAYPTTTHVDIPLSVIPSFMPSVSVVASLDTTLSYLSQIITFFTTVTYGGSSPTYQWYTNRGPIAGATNSSYFQEMYGPDTFYCVINSNGYCAVPAIDTSNIIRIGIGKLDVTELATQTGSFIIYPNPNKGSFTLKGAINNAAGSSINIEIKNMMGQTVYKNATHHDRGIIELPITLDAAIPPGMYYLITADDRGSKATPFIIQ